MKYYMIIFSIVLFIIISIFTFIAIQKEPIKIGIIHSTSGTMAMSEKHVLDATLFSIEQINIQGGLLGRKIEAVVVDGKSSDQGFEDGLNELIKSGVTTIFGGWTSSSRKEMKKILEKENALLFYPLQYEGFESSKNIIYLGLVPNQQVIPTLHYGVENFGNRVFLVGSEYIYPKITNKFIESVSGYANLNIVGEEYKTLGENNFTDVIQKIEATQPSFIINTLNGDSNLAFFNALNKSAISLSTTPVFSFSIAETEMTNISQAIGAKAVEGSYLTWSYFNSLDNAENRELKKLFKQRFGENIVISDPMYTAFMAIKFYANVVSKYNNNEINSLKKNILKESIGGAAGVITIDKKNNHSWKQILIAKVDANATANVVWNSESPQEPKPFPQFIDSKKMQTYEEALYKKWDDSYEANKELK